METEIQLKISKWGHSAAIRLPTHILKSMNTKPGDILTADVTPQGLLLRARQKPKYSLTELLKQCDHNAPRSPELDAWDKIDPAGDEAW